MEKIKITRLINATTFDAELYKLMHTTGCTQADAFAQLNEMHQTAIGRPRYASYNSYLVTRNGRLKNR